MAVGTTIGFPHGGHATAVKVFEARQAMADGATELDMVINIGQAKGGEWDAVTADIAAVTAAAHDGGSIVKVIFENCFLNDEQKVRLCRICGEVGADYVKTSTGYGTGGATMDDLRLMRRSSPPHVKLKAAGGIRTLDAMIEAAEVGCDRIGASRTAEILDELKIRLGAVSGSPSSQAALAGFDPFGSVVSAHDQRVAEADEQARLEHAGDALQLASRALPGSSMESKRQSTI